MRHPVVALALCLALPATLGAQVHLTLRSGPAGAAGHATAPEDADVPDLRPAPTRDVAVATGFDRGAWRVAASLRRTHADLVILGETAGIITTDALRATAVGVEVGRRLVGAPTGPQLHALVGAARERWSFGDLVSESRSRTLLTGALEGEVPLTPHWRAIARVEGARGGSLFTDDELPGGFERRTAWRSALHLGLRVGR